MAQHIHSRSLIRRVPPLAVVLLVVVALALALAGCNRKTSNSGTGFSGTGNKTAALVSPQRSGDNGPVDNMLAGLKKAQALGYKTRFIEDTDPSSYLATLANLGRAHTDIVVVAFPQFASALTAVAPQYPHTRWVHLYADPYKPEIPNVVSLSFDTEAPAYLAGYLASTVSGSGTVGFIGGTAIPAANADFHAFAAGAKAGNRSVRVRGAFVGSYQDPVGAQRLAENMYADGAEVVLTLGGGSSLGVVKAAGEHSKLVITDGTDNASAAANVIGIASQNYGQALYLQLKAFAMHTWKPGTVTYGLPDITFLHAAPLFAHAGPPGEAEAVAKAFKHLEGPHGIQQQIIDGSIKVPFNTAGI